MSNSRSDVDFIRDMLVTALNEKRDSIVSDLFKLYEQVQTTPNFPKGNINIDTFTKPDGTEYNFNLTSDYLDGMAAGPVDYIPGAFGNDVISFGDYKSREDS